jgi:subtilisin family serine protease
VSRTAARALFAASSVAALTIGMVVPPAGAAPPHDRERFIVTVVDGVDSRDVAADHRRGGAEIDFVYKTALNGFAGAMSEAQLGELQRDRRVTRIERDGVVTANETQVNATWGLDRIDTRQLVLDGAYAYDQTGSGVDAYIIDTGIRFSHSDVTGRAVFGYDAFGGTGADCNGHGSHVAGTVGGTTWGVAKAVQLHAVRVLDCNGSGSWSGVIAGLDWVVADHADLMPAVANMSLGGGASSSVDDAVQAVIDDGVTVVVAAGNGNQAGRAQDACNYSPARVPAAVTIGATTSSDAKTSWSNYGSCVDLFAPGASIASAWHTSDSATNTISGTSMAAPHVAGVAALHLQGDPDATAAEVRDAIYAASTKGIVTSSNTANNHLLFSLLTTDATAPNVAPTAAFTHSCGDLSCAFTDGSTDSDGSVASHAWDFGDGTTSTASSPSHTYAAGGTYTVTLTVTDDGGATDATTSSVSVSTGSGSEPVLITLSASGYKVKGVQHADLSWGGATSADVDIHRNGALAQMTANDGAYTDTIGNKGGGSYTYTICEAGTTICSPEVTVAF